MVSFNEYPTIVKKAATTGREISYPSIENIPNVSLILYPKVGHMPPMEIPEIIAEDIKNFIVN